MPLFKRKLKPGHYRLTVSAGINFAGNSSASAGHVTVNQLAGPLHRGVINR